MSLHERAWQGLDLLVYGETPLLAMKVEQAIANVTPANEVKIESFEAFETAYDFCRERKSVGFIFMLENTGKTLLTNAFEEMARHYEAKGLPCFGVILQEEAQSTRTSISAIRAVHTNQKLLACYPCESFIKPGNTAAYLNEMWHLFIQSFEESIVPLPLQKTLLSIAESHFSNENFLFHTRMLNILSGELNISWLDIFSLRWLPVVRALEKVSPKLLDVNEELANFTKNVRPAIVPTVIQDCLDKTIPLAMRLSLVLEILANARLTATLEECLADISSAAKPGSPALLRRISQAKDRILMISKECDQLLQLRNTG